VRQVEECGAGGPGAIEEGENGHAAPILIDNHDKNAKSRRRDRDLWLLINEMAALPVEG
jgi:hypothetical protein